MSNVVRRRLNFAVEEARDAFGVYKQLGGAIRAAAKGASDERRHDVRQVFLGAGGEERAESRVGPMLVEAVGVLVADRHVQTGAFASNSGACRRAPACAPRPQSTTPDGLRRSPGRRRDKGRRLQTAVALDCCLQTAAYPTLAASSCEPTLSTTRR